MARRVRAIAAKMGKRDLRLNQKLIGPPLQLDRVLMHAAADFAHKRCPLDVDLLKAAGWGVELGA